MILVFQRIIHDLLFFNLDDYKEDMLHLLNNENEKRDLFIISNLANESDDISEYITEHIFNIYFEKWVSRIQKKLLLAIY